MNDRSRNPSRTRRFFNWLYPAHDEIVIYSAAVGIIALVFTSHGFRDALAFVAYAFAIEYPSAGFESSIWKGLWHVFGSVMIFLISMASLLISLRLPFTRRRLDALVEPLLVAHIFLIFGSNVLAFNQQQDMASWFLLATSSLYLFIFLVGHRFGFLQLEISHRQATGRQAVIAAAAITVLVAVLTLGFKLHWAHCYALSTASAVGLARILDAR